MPKPAHLIFLNALNGFAAVLLGALGAHALKSRLIERGALDSWQTAAGYQLAHTAAALAVLVWAVAQPERQRRLGLVSALWLFGCLCFSGSIYLLALGGPRLLGPITPLGGLAFLAGWALLAAESLRKPSAP